ncbi:MAG: 16S rRNA (guanine(966)-N(2))-methyltransferase RsmD [Rickettsiaceae bacterium]
MLRIITGKYKNKLIPIPKHLDYKPSKSKCREAIFSILSGYLDFSDEMNEIAVLDLFSGSGILGFEAISRGAKSLTLVDNHSEQLNISKLFIESINCSLQVKFLKMDATELPKARYQYDLLFIDPPYHKDLVNKTLDSLISGSWLKSNAFAVILTEKKANITPPNELQIITDRNYGNTKLSLFNHKY